MAKRHEKHLALTTGTVACSGRLTASYRAGATTEDWTDVKCPKCRATGFYQYRMTESERAATNRHRKEKTTMYHAVNFTVRGGGPFPFDMLRYNGCHPRTQEEVTAMMNSGEFRDVKLTMYHQPGDRDAPHRERWKSFLWSIVEDSVAPVD